jgi:hypothetical protein
MLFMRWLRRRRPTISIISLVFWTWMAMWLLVVVLEWPLLIVPGFASWAGAFDGLTLMPGSRYQYPIVVPDPALWGAVLTALAALRFLCSDTGQSKVEAGVGRVRPGRRRALVSTFAIVGFANVVIGIYGFLWIAIAFFLGPTI